ncbi:MAG TPA: hypothetical protein PK364_02675 [Synergistaceae bacterium]|nr:hypothetical protein [Synergistaceae bacterium]HPJ25587.1 hypothetical protein [Synergistaceae bacterium]HPQ37726.1 hypothetical protein [Synergistaceae bacterium]
MLLDFSGTLSRGAAEFGFPENLERALKESGLESLGVRNIEDFWSRCIIPFWKRGSTSNAGYGALLEKALREKYGASEEAAREGAIHFRNFYFGASRIDPLWKSLLEYVANRREITGVIVTDHYAELSAHLEKELKEMGLRGISLKKAPSLIPEKALGIANSADLGFTKDREDFWETLRRHLPSPFEDISLVEDFGANESAGDAYGNPRKVLERRRKTAEHIRKIFHRSPVIYDCALPGKCKKEEKIFSREYENRVLDITQKIKESLT